MTKFREDKNLSNLRTKFFNGEIGGPMPSNNHNNNSKNTNRTMTMTKEEEEEMLQNLTSEQRFHRIDGRLRNVIRKACCNSAPASMIIDTFEKFLVRAYHGKRDKLPRDVWVNDMSLIEPPTITIHRTKNGNDKKKKKEQQQKDKQEQKEEEEDSTSTATNPTKTSSSSSMSKNKMMKSKLTIRFLFDGQSSTGGFNRLLVHGLCQFHGLQVQSSSTEIITTTTRTKTQTARMLTATGILSGTDVNMVQYVCSKKNIKKDKIGK